MTLGFLSLPFHLSLLLFVGFALVLVLVLVMALVLDRKVVCRGKKSL